MISKEVTFKSNDHYRKTCNKIVKYFLYELLSKQQSLWKMKIEPSNLQNQSEVLLFLPFALQNAKSKKIKWKVSFFYLENK